MAVRMTHLVWRKGWAYFRFKLPDDLAGKPIPNAWPDDLKTLVNSARRTFKIEIWKSLELTKKDEQRAKRAVAAKIAETTSLIDEARLLLARGPVAAIGDEDIAAIVARVHADRLAHDEQLRLQGIGLRLPRAADVLRIPSVDQPIAPEPEEPGLTEDDLGLLRFGAEKVHKEMQEAAVRMRPPAAVKQRVAEELAKRGAEPTPEERRKIEIEVLKAELRAWSDIRARLDGEIIPTRANRASRSARPDAQTGVRPLEGWRWSSWRQTPERKYGRRSRGCCEAVCGAARQSAGVLDQTGAGSIVS
ncbi:hypothetical protein [Bradyrhizobium sp. JYMT SZCCT0428]|uniref:hypothetical protein n=1 Tax=Bradyrhizobium sp. JYMT SZCCT0428 TaxID=2807673 RepID=UPI001BA87048|nr:hypothetical protein [Bradyrhizobium sp. JYMT SZCCT0428]MBR1154383.1 hypothetical protein [Bradyrhizobium sp. JYMT SZCCT0428]